MWFGFRQLRLRPGRTCISPEQAVPEVRVLVSPGGAARGVLEPPAPSQQRTEREAGARIPNSKSGL